MTTKAMQAFRTIIAPQLASVGLNALRKALIEDDHRLIQGCTTSPLPLDALMECKVEGGCAIGYAGWIGHVYQTVGEVSEFFERVCDDPDCRYFLDWYDESPRAEMRRELLAEIDVILATPRRAA